MRNTGLGELLGSSRLRGPQQEQWSARCRRGVPGGCFGARRGSAREQACENTVEPRVRLGSQRGPFGQRGDSRRGATCVGPKSLQQACHVTLLDDGERFCGSARAADQHGESVDRIVHVLGRIGRIQLSSRYFRQRHRAGLELGLLRVGIDGVIGHRVDRQGFAELVAPVERREAASG